MTLTIQERLKDLRVERGLTKTPPYALIKMAKFYGVTAVYQKGKKVMHLKYFD